MNEGGPLFVRWGLRGHVTTWCTTRSRAVNCYRSHHVREVSQPSCHVPTQLAAPDARSTCDTVVSSIRGDGAAVQITEEDLTDARQFLSQIGVWPSPVQLDIAAWLSNFDQGQDREIALALLESVVHMSEEHVLQAALSAFAGISGLPRFRVPGGRRGEWERFLDQAFVTYPTSSDSDVTGSGNIFARALRDAGIDASRIRGPADCVTQIKQRGLTVPLVFVDDLSATGSQFERTWKRVVSTANGPASFELLAAAGQLSEVFYAPVAATDHAVEALAREAPQVLVAPAYRLGPEYYCSSELTRMIPSNLVPHLPAFLERYAEASAAGESRPYGFGALGLLLSFHHGIPNNAPPIVQRRTSSTRAEWKTLIA